MLLGLRTEVIAEGWEAQQIDSCNEIFTTALAHTRWPGISTCERSNSNVIELSPYRDIVQTPLFSGTIFWVVPVSTRCDWGTEEKITSLLSETGGPLKSTLVMQHLLQY
jgi:hypothetical protein